MEFTNAGLTRVDVLCSAVLNTDLPSCWRLTRDFGRSKWLSKAGDMQFRVLSVGSRTTEVGSVRVFMIGNAQLFEQLTALDDCEHVLRWICMSHPQTISPFLRASFVNYQSSLHMRPITVGNQTYAEWKGHFWTEPQHAAFMHATIEEWYLAGFKGLQACCLKPQLAVVAAKQLPGNGAQHSVVGGADILRDRTGLAAPPQVVHMAHPVRAAQNGDPNPNPAAAVMDSYLVNDQYFAGTPAQSAGAPSPEDSNSSGSDQAGQGHATPSSHAFQAARAALGHTSRRPRGHHSQAARSQLASVKEGEKGPPHHRSDIASSTQPPSSRGVSTATPAASSSSRSSNSKHLRSSVSVDRSDIERWRQEAQQRQHASFDLPTQQPQEHPAVNKLREQAAKQAALNSDHSTRSAASNLAQEITTSSCSNSWDSNKASRDDLPPATNVQVEKPPAKAPAIGDPVAQPKLVPAGSCGIPYDTSNRGGKREYAIVMDDAEAQIMGQVSDNLAAQRGHRDDDKRNSFEEEAAALSARHAALHRKRMANAANGATVCPNPFTLPQMGRQAQPQASPFSSPFAKPSAASPFAQQPAGQASSVASAAMGAGRQHQGAPPQNMGMCNPFAAAQPLAGRIG